MTEKQRIGNAGEAHAAAYLAERGYTILHRQYRIHPYELDLICRTPDDQMLVFVEVRSRSVHGFGTPEESIGAKKRKFLVRGAEAFLAQTKQENARCRLDVVAVWVDSRGGLRKIEHYPDAFWAN